jgi:hypothetical protein
MIYDAQYEQVLAELKALVHRHVIPRYSWYQKHTLGPRSCFRISGLMVVIGSLLLPVITTYETLWHKRIILAIVSLTVAVLSSLSTFYKWDYAWQTREKAALELKGFLATWELNLIAAQ